MIRFGPHMQNSLNNWPLTFARFKARGLAKFVYAAERGEEAKKVNPDGLVWYRWVGGQPLPTSNFEQHCRDWLNQFVDGTFEQKTSKHIDLLNEYNETLANSQSAEEKALWIKLHTTMAKVWAEEYRPRFPWMRLVLCETAVGNDIPVEIARAAEQYDAVLGYHPYQVCRVGPVISAAVARTAAYGRRFDGPRASFRNDANELYIMEEAIIPSALYRAYAYDEPVNRPAFVSPHDWRWYSGRWAEMDNTFTAQGIVAQFYPL